MRFAALLAKLDEITNEAPSQPTQETRAANGFVGYVVREPLTGGKRMSWILLAGSFGLVVMCWYRMRRQRKDARMN